MAHNSYGIQNEWVSRFATPASRLKSTQERPSGVRIVEEVYDYLADRGYPRKDVEAMSVEDRHWLLKDARRELLTRKGK